MTTTLNSAQNGKVEFFENAVKRGVLSAQDLQDYKEQKKQFQTEEIFLRKQLTGLSGVLELINENDVRKNCVTNLSKGSVPEEKNIIMDKLGVRFGYSATQIDPALVAYTNAIFNIADTDFDAGTTATGDTTYARVIPVQFQNSEYEFRADGVLVDTGRMEDLLTQNVSVDGVNGGDKNFKQLEWPKLLLSGKKLAFDIKFPEATGVPIPAGFFYAEIVAKGLGLGKRQVQ